MSEWVHSLAPWTTFCTFTFRDRLFARKDGSLKACGVKIDSAKRYYERFMKKEFPDVSYFYAVEENPSRDGHHIHALLAERSFLFRKEMWAAWFKTHGRNRVEPVRGLEDVADYCSKYVTKEGAWWDLLLKPWHLEKVSLVPAPAFALVP